MGRRLILCEKPMLARFAVSCLHEKFQPMKFNNSSYPTYFESENYVISWAIGHLFEAYDIEEYTKSEEGWTLNNLPFCPPDNHFLFKLRQSRDPKTGKKVTDPGYKMQFETIKNLINRSDVTGIVHFGDAAREGEIIIRQVIQNTAKSEKPVVRLWLSAMSPEAFREAFSNMKPDSEYDNYANEGMARIKVDYLYGVNLTRYVTLKSGSPKGKPLGVGRVLSAMVQEIYDREVAIETFVPEKYYALVSKTTCGDNYEISLRVKEHYSIADYVKATEKCAELNNAGAIVTKIEKKQSTVSAKKLFSLTSLQNILSSKYKISLDSSMKTIQSVYEKGYITYPRTNADCLPDAEKANVEKLIELFNNNGYELEIKVNKSIFDSSKVEDHGALCPTMKLPTSDLSGDELIVYETVRNRFLAVFCKELYTVDKSTMTFQCASEIFTINGTIMVTPGWTKYEAKEQKDTYLPPLNENDKIEVSFTPTEEETKAPARYSESTFNDFLENPYSSEKQTDEERYESLMKGLEIGTVASRTGIISSMKRYGYVSLKNQTYYLEPAGRYIVTVMRELGIIIDKNKTVETSVWLKNIFRGEYTENQVIEIVKKELEQMFLLRDKDVTNCVESGIVSASGFATESLGECPLCGGNIYETTKGFICENNKRDTDDCFFYLSKEDKFLSKVANMKLKTSNVQSLLKNGYLTIKAKSQKGIEYECMTKLRLKDERLGWELFNNFGKCPICGGNVKSTPIGYVCENNNEAKDCFFILFRKDRFVSAFQGGKELSLKQAATVLNKGSLILSCDKKDKSGKYKVKLIPEYDRINKKMSWTKEFVNEKKS